MDNVKPEAKFEHINVDPEKEFVQININPEKESVQINVKLEANAVQIPDGTEILKSDYLSKDPDADTIFLPASLKVIEDGALSNGGSWVEGKTGITKIYLDGGNKNFVLYHDCLCSKDDDGSLRLIRMSFINNALPEKLVIPSGISRIAPYALKGLKSVSVYLEETDTEIYFPVSQAFYHSGLIESFGKNNSLYDFEKYDAYLLQPFFNPEKIKMFVERIKSHYGISEEKRTELITYLRDNAAEVISSVILKGSVNEFEVLKEIDYFDSNILDLFIEKTIAADKPELSSWLMNYKSDEVGFDDFDFSI